MPGSVKDVIIRDITTPAVTSITTSDYVSFSPVFIHLLDEVLDHRTLHSWGRQPEIQKITISPIGVPYPGDVAPGNGAKKVTLDFLGGVATVIMTRVEQVDTSTGWVIITKGDHVIAYSPAVIAFIIVEPTP